VLREAIEDALVDVSLDTSPRLFNDLVHAVGDLRQARRAAKRRDGAAEAARRGTLTTSQRRQLRALSVATEGWLRRCGADVEALQRLIGGDAVMGLNSNGLTLAGLAHAMACLNLDFSIRLSYAPRAPRGRKTDDPFHAFCLDVTLALADAGETPSVSRTGSVARVMTVMLQAARLPLPRDLTRHIARAVAAVPSARAKRSADEAFWREFEAGPEETRSN
jgi:hypothetical protein